MGDVDNDGFMTFNEFKGMSERLQIPFYTTEVNRTNIETNSLKVCLLQKTSKLLFWKTLRIILYNA